MTEEQIKKARHNYASRVYHEQMRSASEGEVYGFEVGYRAAYSEIEAQLSSKEQELDKTNDILIELRAENERLKDDINVHVAVIENANLNFKDQQEEIKRLNRVITNLRRVSADKEIELRKRCEDLEAEIESMKRNRLEHWIKLLSQ